MIFKTFAEKELERKGRAYDSLQDRLKEKDEEIKKLKATATYWHEQCKQARKGIVK